eukprot:scaffold5929_cov120-Isochrysis_galbana.AAC.3
MVGQEFEGRAKVVPHRHSSPRTGADVGGTLTLMLAPGTWDALLRPTGAGLGTCTRIFRHSAQPRKHLPSRTPIFPVEASPYSAASRHRHSQMPARLSRRLRPGDARRKPRRHGL